MGDAHPNRDRLDALFRSDPYTGFLGAALAGWDGGTAEVRWVPGVAQRNFTGSVHGGALFSVADLALAVASNSWGRVCVALSVEVHYLAAPPDDVAVVARATERARTRRTGSYAIEVRSEGDGDALVATLQAMVFRTGGWHFGPDVWPEDWIREH